MKHGLAIVPGNTAIQLLDGDEVLLAVEGTSVELLEHSAWIADRERGMSRLGGLMSRRA
ncbi:MAG: hypothetical protein LC808_07650 [Actinobacteria bacterium]|nr:hypothetical protein [Actinomycetota bacterium]